MELDRKEGTMSMIYVAHGFSLQKKRFQVHHRVFTRANGWTVSGIACVVAYILLYITSSYVIFIPLCVGYIILSDILDGKSAEKWDAHTYIGAVLDPLRDRLLGFAILGNILLLAERELFPLLLGLTGALLVFEACIAIGNTLWGKGVHLAGKLRFGIHCIAGMQFILQTYYPWSLCIPEEYIFLGMALASLATLVIYTTTWLLDR